jgi:hypothetical protein
VSGKVPPPPTSSLVMAGLVPAIHVLEFARCETWMAGTSPGHDGRWWYGRAGATAMEMVVAGTPL